MQKKPRQEWPSYNAEISRYFFSISLIIPLTFILAVITFREPFHFWHHAFSKLGETTTPQGYPNLLSQLVFSIGWLACSLLMFRISQQFRRNRELKHRMFKQWLALVGSIGFVVAIVPNDVNHILHSIGMGLVVAVTYFFGVFFLIELRPTLSPLVFYVNMLFLQSAVLTYAVTFFSNSTLKQAAQKFCVLALLLVVEKASTIAPEGYEWKTALQAHRAGRE